MPDQAFIEFLKIFVAPAVTLTGFLFIGEQLKVAKDNYKISVDKSTQEQNWKKAEFLAKEAKDFFSDKRVERIVYMLDWSDRVFEFKDRHEPESYLIYSDGEGKDRAYSGASTTSVPPPAVPPREIVLSHALRRHEDKTPQTFDHGEMIVRDEFDWFFFRLGMFQQFIDSKVIVYKEIDGLIAYILELLDPLRVKDPMQSRRSRPLEAALKDYIAFYRFTAVSELLDARRAHLGEKKLALAPANPA